MEIVVILAKVIALLVIMFAIVLSPIILHHVLHLMDKMIYRRIKTKMQKQGLTPQEIETLKKIQKMW